MGVVDRLALREATWRELDALLDRLDGGRPGRKKAEKPRRPARIKSGPIDPPAPVPPPPPRKAGAAEVVRLGELYRSACADLMLAEAYDLPRDTVAYLHDLVARSHNLVYRGRGFHIRRWAGEILATVPRRLRADPMLKIAAAVFYGFFLLFGLVGAARPELAERVASTIGANFDEVEHEYSAPIGSGERVRSDAYMAGFYVRNNAGIGLKAFAWGLALGLGTLYILFTNGMSIGLIFGHMMRTPQAGNFYTFVTAHGPFELTAIVFSGAAGLRLGYSLIDTRGRSRIDSLRAEAIRALPTMGAAVFLFLLAAFLEGFVSASSLPYAAKAGIAAASATILALYLALGGRGEAIEEGAGRAP